MIVCDIKDRKRQSFYTELFTRIFYGEAYLNPNFTEEFEEILMSFIEKMQITQYGRWKVKLFLEVFDFETYTFNHPKELSKLSKNTEGEYSGSVNHVGASIWKKKERFELYKPYLLFNEYNDYYVRRKQKALKPIILIRDGFKCARCSSKDSLQIHHKKPVSKFGKSTEDNLITLCKHCHREVHRTKEKNFFIV